MNQNEIKKTEDLIDKTTLLSYLQTLNNHLTEAETNQFLQISLAYGLNPFKREIYASKYGGNFSIVVGYETYIKRAERSGLLDGWKVTTSGAFNPSNPRNSDLKATITIFRSDFKHPFEHEVEFAEYCQFTKEGNVTKFWKEKPMTMIKKVAISQGFRLCFSDELGGLPYTKEEIGQEEASFTTVSSEPLSGPANVTISKHEPVSVVPVNNHEEEAKKIEAILQNALKVVETAKTVEGLRRIWEDFSSLQTDKRFSSAVNAKKLKIVEAEKAIQAEQAETVETIEEAETIQSTDSQEFDSKQFSNSLLAKDAVEQLSTLKTVEEIESFVTFETRETVLNSANKMISKLKSNSLFNEE